MAYQVLNYQKLKSFGISLFHLDKLLLLKTFKTELETCIYLKQHCLSIKQTFANLVNIQTLLKDLISLKIWKPIHTRQVQ